MDKTKEFILMCEKAEEIQKIFLDREYNQMDFYKWVKSPRGKYVIWLPHQDQLQEMVKSLLEKRLDIELSYWGLNDLFFTWCLDNRIKDWSMEQLWLAFVMKEKYNKTWNGKEWEK